MPLTGPEIKFPVETIFDGETGALYILRTDKQLEVAAAALRREAKLNVAALLATGKIKEETPGEALAFQIARIDADLSQRKAERDAGRKSFSCGDNSRVYELSVYLLNKPTYIELLRAQDAARTQDEVTGNVETDMNKLMDELLPRAITGKKIDMFSGDVKLEGKSVKLSEEEVRGFDPTLATYLWGRLYSAIYPDERQLAFMSAPSSPS